MSARQQNTRQRVYIIPTAFGLTSSLVVGGVAIFASANNSSSTLAACGVILLAGMLAMFQTNGGMLGVKLSQIQVEDVAVGRQIPVRITIINGTRQPKYMLEIGVDRGFWRKSTSVVVVENIPASTSTEVVLYLESRQRGVHPLPAISIATKFPLGICKAWINVSEGRDMVVYPEPKGDEQTFHNQKGWKEGQVHQHEEGDFWGHRAYVPGDSLAHVDWKAQARGRGMLTKQYSHGTTLSHDFDYSDAAGDSVEEKLRQLSYLIHFATENDQSFSLKLPERILASNHGANQFRIAMRALAEVPSS